MKTAARFLLKVLHSAAAGSHDHVLLGNLGIVSVDGVCPLCRQPLAKDVRQLGLQAAGIHSGLHASQNVEPVRVRLLEDAGLSFENWFDVQGNPEGWWIAVDAVPEKSGRSDADDCDRLVLDVKRGADDAGVSRMGGLPGFITKNRYRGSAGPGANVHHVLSRLEGGQLFELGRGLAEVAIEIVGEEIEVAVVVHEAAIHTAVVDVSY